MFACYHHSDLLTVGDEVYLAQFGKEVDDNYYNFEIQKKKKYYLAVLR